MSIETLVKRLAEASYQVRRNPTYTGILEDRAMDAHIVVAVMHDYARARGFSNFEHMDRFLSPAPECTVQPSAHEKIITATEGHTR